MYGSNEIQTHNHLVRKQTLNHLPNWPKYSHGMYCEYHNMHWFILLSTCDYLYEISIVVRRLTMQWLKRNKQWAKVLLLLLLLSIIIIIIIIIIIVYYTFTYHYKIVLLSLRQKKQIKVNQKKKKIMYLYKSVNIIVTQKASQ